MQARAVVERPSTGVDVTSATATAKRIVDNVSRVLEGKREVIELAVIALLARGHILIEDVPGVGKTTLARALARSLGVSFRRIQFTSDLMPADVVGGSVFEQASASFSFRPGPIFTNVLLADEINRTTPKTQSALLEAMAEGQVSVDGHTHVLEEPFLVLATQNPHDLYGTYPLPESQLDRFLMRTAIGYPAPQVERRVIHRRRGEDPTEGLDAVVDRATLLAAYEVVDSVRVEDLLVEYLHEIVVDTRNTQLLSLGVSTRAALALEQAVRARAVVQGRDFAIPDDVKTLAVPVLAHRVRLRTGMQGDGARTDAEGVVRDLVSRRSVPV